MDFRLLGPFEAWHDGNRVNVGAGKQIQVLVALLLRANRPVGLHRLAEVAWPNPADRKAKNVITYVYRLNRAFKDAGATDVVIDTESTGYVLRARPEQIDYVWFERLRERARQLSAAGDIAAAGSTLHEALRLYLGEFMADLEPEPGDLNLRDSLAEAHLDLLGDLAEHELAAGNHRWVRDHLQPILRDQPMRQRLAALLMEALLLDDDPERAVEVYRRTKDALDDERGMLPSRRLKDLMWRAQFGEARTSLPPVRNEIIGREDELAAMDTSVSRAGMRLDGPEVVWISGMPGVGKTAIAVHAATRAAQTLRHAQLYVDLRGYTPNVAPMTPAEALDQLLRLLGVPAGNLPPTIEGKIAKYRAWLDGNRAVIVLDNAVSERQVEPLLPVSPGCLVIVTSRHVGGPHAHARIHLDPLPLAAAVRLFTNVVGRQRVREQWSQVEEIVSHCGRVPMQIRVVATQLLQHPTWPLDHLVRLLRAHSALQLDAAAADESGAAACAVSYGQLGDDQQRLFLLFGLAPSAELDGHAAAALVGVAVPRATALLADLHRVSLLIEVAPERYQMPDLLRSYAVSLATAQQRDVPSMLRPLLDYYLTTTAAAVAAAFPFDRHRQPPVPTVNGHRARFDGYRDALQWLSAEHACLVAAVRYSASIGDADYTSRLALLLWRYFYTTGHFHDWSATLELTLRLIAGETVTSKTDERTLADVLLRLSGARWAMGELGTALELAERSLRSWTAVGDRRGEADALCAMALAAKALGRYPAARGHLESALRRYETLDDLQGQASTLGNLGVLDERERNFADAESHHLRAGELLIRIGHLPGQMHSRDNLGSVRQHLGRLDEAMADHQAALELAVRIGDRGGEGHALNNVGNVLLRQGRPAEAINYHNRALAIANETGDLNLRTDAHNDLGEACRAAGMPEAALRSHLVALELAAESGDTRQRMRAHLGVARALHATDRHADAAEHWQAAISGYRDLDATEAAAVASELRANSCGCASTAG